MATSQPRSGFSIIPGDTDPVTARSILAAAAAAGVDPGSIDYSQQSGGYVVPSAVVPFYSGPDHTYDYLDAAFNDTQVKALLRLIGSGTGGGGTYLELRATPPDHTVAAAYLDTSVVPPVLKTWNGSGWAAAGAVVG